MFSNEAIKEFRLMCIRHKGRIVNPLPVSKTNFKLALWQKTRGVRHDSIKRRRKENV